MIVKLKQIIMYLEMKEVFKNRIKMFLMIIIQVFVLKGCCGNKSNFVSIDKKTVSDTSIIIKSIPFDSVLFSHEKRVDFSQNHTPFTLTVKNDNQEYTAITKIKKHNVVYSIMLTRNDLNEKFDWGNEKSYVINEMSISIDGAKTQISNIKLFNTNRKINPSGLWHWSVEDCTLKYYQTENKEYYFINGADLFCNGTSCNTNQLLIIVKELNKYVISAIEYYDIIPYYFVNMVLFDKNNDNIPEFYLPINGNIGDINMKNFHLFSFDDQNRLNQLPL